MGRPDDYAEDQESIMRLPFFGTIRTHLLLLISVLPALAIIIYAGWDRSRHEIERAKLDALQTVKNFSYDHERAVESTRQFLITLAKPKFLTGFVSSPLMLLDKHRFSISRS